jgi:hypothetical protein
MFEALGAQSVLTLHQKRIRTPEHKTPDSIGDAAALDSQPFVLQELRTLHISREKHVKRRAVL